MRAIIQAILIVSAVVGFATRAHPARPDLRQGRIPIAGGLDRAGEQQLRTNGIAIDFDPMLFDDA